MVTIAVAGGTGNIGRTICDALKGSTKHKTIILARKAPETQDPEQPVVAVDYSNIDQIVEILEENNVHTVISALLVISSESGVSERTLIKAAAKSSTTKRFIASEWGIPLPDDPKLALEHHPERHASIAELRKTDLEWTRFHNGYFLDYYGSGDDIMSFTYTRDLAKFVVTSLDLPKWEEATSCYGDQMTWREFVKIAEEVTGSKFNVVYDSEEKLKKGEISELPDHFKIYSWLPKAYLQPHFAKFGLFTIHGVWRINPETALNKVFPEIKTTTVREMLEYWRGK